jgi:hypothetical protein
MRREKKGGGASGAQQNLRHFSAASSREANNADSSGGEDESEFLNRKTETETQQKFLETCGLCGLAAEVVLGVEVNWEKPQLSASFGLCKSVPEQEVVDVGVGGNQ